MKFKVSDQLFKELPNVCFGIVVAKGIDNTKNYPEINTLLDASIASAAKHFSGKRVKEEALIAPYRNAFRALGINPNKYMCSIEALITRIAKGKEIPHINPVVDLGNALSLKYTLPIGAHDLRDVEEIDVRPAVSGDTFLPFSGDKEEAPDIGEMVYTVGSQVRTRRWTWRQSEHGKIRADTSCVFFPIDGFTDFNQERVIEARNDLSKQIKKTFNCETICGFVNAEKPEIIF